MRFVVTVEHAFEVAGRIAADGAEIYVHHQEQGNDKTDDHMHEIGKMYRPVAKNVVKQVFRIQEHPACDHDHRYADVHDHHVAEALQRVELVIFRNREGRFLPPEHSIGVIQELLADIFHITTKAEKVLPAIGGDQVPNHEENIAQGKDDPGNIVDAYGIIEPDDRVLGIGVLHTYTGNDEQYDQYGI